MINFSDVQISYGNTKVLEDFNCDIAKGEIVTLFGPSGCGKSTLLKAVLGILKPSGGQVTIEGIPAYEYNRVISYTPQDNQLLPWLSIRDNVDLWRKESGGEEGSLAQILEVTGLIQHEHKLLKELSGGMARRAALARGMATSSSIMCLDEVLVSVERKMRRKLMVNLRSYLKENNVTALIISHDYEEAVYMSDRILVLSPPPAEVVRSIVVGDVLGATRDEMAFEHSEFIRLTTILLN